MQDVHKLILCTVLRKSLELKISQVWCAEYMSAQKTLLLTLTTSFQRGGSNSSTIYFGDDMSVYIDIMDTH